jgi:hypothetical protein
MLGFGIGDAMGGGVVYRTGLVGGMCSYDRIDGYTKSQCR